MRNFCQNCGTKIGANVKYCPSCGELICPESVNEALSNDFKLRFFSCRGRLNRKRYLMRIVSLVALSFGVAALVGFIVALAGGERKTVDILCMLSSLPFSVALLMQHIRRFHDLGKSGWFLLTCFIPLINFLILLYLLFAKGDEGTNRFGPDPLLEADNPHSAVSSEQPHEKSGKQQ